eukprot:6460940-Amphidinium_carterae.2
MARASVCYRAHQRAPFQSTSNITTQPSTPSGSPFTLDDTELVDGVRALNHTRSGLVLNQQLTSSLDYDLEIHIESTLFCTALKD